MQKTMALVGGVLGGAALLGVGVAVGAQVGQEQALIAAADAQGPLTAQDKLLLGSFTQASQNFDMLVARAQKGKQVGPQMTRQAVSVLNVKRLSASEPLRNAADTTSKAMLLIGAGVTTDDTGTVEEGIEAYGEARQALVELAREINPDAEIADPTTQPEESSAPEGQDKPSGQ